MWKYVKNVNDYMEMITFEGKTIIISLGCHQSPRVGHITSQVKVTKRRLLLPPKLVSFTFITTGSAVSSKMRAWHSIARTRTHSQLLPWWLPEWPHPVRWCGLHSSCTASSDHCWHTVSARHMPVWRSGLPGRTSMRFPIEWAAVDSRVADGAGGTRCRWEGHIFRVKIISLLCCLS